MRANSMKFLNNFPQRCCFPFLAHKIKKKVTITRQQQEPYFSSPSKIAHFLNHGLYVYVLYIQKKTDSLFHLDEMGGQKLCHSKAIEGVHLEKFFELIVA